MERSFPSHHHSTVIPPLASLLFPVSSPASLSHAWGIIKSISFQLLWVRTSLSFLTRTRSLREKASVSLTFISLLFCSSNKKSACFIFNHFIDMESGKAQVQIGFSTREQGWCFKTEKKHILQKDVGSGCKTPLSALLASCHSMNT